MALVTAAVAFVVAVAAAQVGTNDTIGGTTYDWQGAGPAWRMYCNAPEYGRHALWMYSACTSGTSFPDLNMRYNFRDSMTGHWNWTDPDFMASGVNIYTERSGFGNLAVDQLTGVALTVAHGGSPLRPLLARDMFPGAGIFAYCPGPQGYQWPVLAVGLGSWRHVALIDNATQDQVWYSRCTTWCQWDAPRRLSGEGGPDPGFPSHNIAASLMSLKVCVIWTENRGWEQEFAYYRVSTDGGTTWGATETLPMPPAYGPDTLPSLTITSPFPYYDRHDRLHIMADVVPVVHDTMYIMPAEIWHWCEANMPQWSRVHRAGCAPEHLQASVGYNATYACRPSVGEDGQGRLYAAWEQFDSSNVEPQTYLLRAGIWVAASMDNGESWHFNRLITERNTVSHRFPSIIDFTSDYDFNVLYMDDLVAGFYVQGQGPATGNPILAHHGDTTGVEETKDVQAGLKSGGASVVRRVLHWDDGRRASLGAVLLDATGRRAARLWPGANDVSRLAPGVYFVRSDGGRRLAEVQKVVITR